MNTTRKEEEKFCIKSEVLDFGECKNLWDFVNYADSYSASFKKDLESFQNPIVMVWSAVTF